MKTIVYSHPWEGSFNHAILSSIKKELKAKGEKFQVIDLHKDGFNPSFSAEELKLFNQGDTPYQLVKDYQIQLRNTTELIFIFPVWWWDLPAMLKGFIDKVMLQGFAISVAEKGVLTGLLTYIKKTSVITTSTAEKEYLVTEGGNAIQGVFIDRTLADIGLKNKETKWVHFPRVDLTTDHKRARFLKELPEKILN
ncbi:NAD(P)H-dependent oxidoreductase [Salibacterium aidingense]|uniref:NAD(P)H-dependent oxidoreductase n=1 Tax=Salibacterium aidingense TaxID=384933 RepID=UPI00040B9EFB|nr:NAD(P)H-dependent oxidoreductase [Salibacterium aidingense]